MDSWIRNPKVVYIIALMLSILLWIVVHMEDQQKTPTLVAETDRFKEIGDVSIETIGLDEGKFKLVAIDPNEVRLRVTGRSSDLAKVTPQNVKVRLDLTHAVNGKQNMRLEAVGFSPQVEVEIIPSTVSVIIEEKLTREMPVIIEAVGSPAEGLVVGTPIVQPNRVFVTTPESAIDHIETIRGVIDVKGASENVTKQIKLIAYNQDGKEVEAEIVPSVVEVEVPITLPSKTMPLKIRLSGTLAPGYSVSSFEQSLTDVVVFGNQNILNSMEFYDGGIVDITDLNADKTITLNLASMPNVAKVEPNQVQVTLRVVQSEVRVFEQVKLTLTGLSDVYEATITDPADGLMSVTLEGSTEALDGIKPEDIDLIVDVGNLSAGQHKVNISYSLPALVRVVGDNSVQVEVDIKEVLQQIEQETTAE